MIPKFNLTLYTNVYQLRTEGKLVYEYNPFHNYRLNSDQTYTDIHGDEIKYESGSIVDLITDKLNFSINSPVNIICQGSYDGSVNLILEDGRNRPRLINSRFTPLENNTYKVINRTGDNDSNIYDEDTFDVDISLYKSNINFPKVKFLGLGYGGNLKVGSYSFYFKYVDSDGNESDFVEESSIVPCYIGNIDDPYSIRGGITDENSYKSIHFKLTDVDYSYTGVSVYYTRNSSDVDGICSTKAYKIDKSYPIVETFCDILVTGDESVEEISIDDINTEYYVLNSAKAQEVCQNILFKGNIQVGTFDNEDLADISLRIYAEPGDEDAKDVIGYVDKNYSFTTSPEYYNAENIYYKLGYWRNEIYRFGIVYITSTGEMSPVYNIRGSLNGSVKSTDIEEIYDINDNTQRSYIKVYPENFQIYNTEQNPQNSKGVIRLKYNNFDDSSDDNFKITSIKFTIPDGVRNYLRKKGIYGFFFVRQKRIPTILAQALVLDLSRNANIPLIPINGRSNAETITTTNGVLNQNFQERFKEDSQVIQAGAAICPEYELQQPYFNNIFTGSKIPVSLATTNNSSSELSGISRNFYVDKYQNIAENNVEEVSIIAIGDSMPLVRIDDVKFRGKAGEAEEAYKFKTIGSGILEDSKDNVVRGNYGPYLGIVGLGSTYTAKIINIHIPGFSERNINTYFTQRYQDSSPYYAISNRMRVEDLYSVPVNERVNIEGTKFDNIIKCYRGDCFICNYTHRLNRNFQDPTAPNNDEIVDQNTFKDNYKKGDSESNAKINRGDLNAIQLGSWITFKLYSNINLSYRNIDDSYPTEIGLTGSPRSFYPLQEMIVDGSNKIPESFVYNTGYTKTLSDKYRFSLPDVPYIKNIFQTRIIYSDVAVTDAFKNGFRVFNKNHYRDYTSTHGGIMKLVEWFGNLVCVFEHGVALIPVNERAIAGEGSGGNVYINTSNVLPENPKMLSETFGSQWADSVIKTPQYIYGVDTVGKKIWRTNGETFELISDFKVQKFLNDNISLSERELTPTIGIRNVKTHYNAYKHDVMFTFYDNLYGFEENVWNICYNELLQKWITFYSWIPSYSENIDNIFFSFNRDISKQISKLAVSRENCNDANGIVLEDNIFTRNRLYSKLNVVNRPIPTFPAKSTITLDWKFTIDPEDYNGQQYFQIKTIEDIINESNLEGDALTKELESKYPSSIKDGSPILTDEYLFFKESKGGYEKLCKKSTWLVRLNARFKVNVDNIDSWQNYLDGWDNYIEVNAKYYSGIIAISAEDVINADDIYFESSTDKSIRPSVNLCSDFWKHGQSGIIDIKDKIRPCHWYGQQHPFELEFVVADKPGVHKIFNNLQIISNKTQPESFHYEIVGESYSWAEDKKNIYVRQEATKHLYQSLGSNIIYNKNYIDLIAGKTELLTDPITNKKYLENSTPGLECPEKSTIFPWYYEKIDTFNDIYNLYQIATSQYTPRRDYQNLTGTEVIYDEQMNEFRLVTHSKFVDIKKDGRIRGNSEYKNDLWMVTIPSIKYMQKNETKEEWGEDQPKPPIILNNIPNDIQEDEITESTIQKLNQ